MTYYSSYDYTHYFLHFHRILDTAHQFLFTSFVYYYAVTNFANPLALGTVSQCVYSI